MNYEHGRYRRCCHSLLPSIINISVVSLSIAEFEETLFSYSKSLNAFDLFQSIKFNDLKHRKSFDSHRAEKVRFKLFLMRMNQKLKCIFTEREIFLSFSLYFSSVISVRYEKIVHETEKIWNYFIDEFLKKSFQLFCAFHELVNSLHVQLNELQITRSNSNKPKTTVRRQGKRNKKSA